MISLKSYNIKKNLLIYLFCLHATPPLSHVQLKKIRRLAKCCCCLKTCVFINLVIYLTYSFPHSLTLFHTQTHSLSAFLHCCVPFSLFPPFLPRSVFQIVVMSWGF